MLAEKGQPTAPKEACMRARTILAAAALVLGLTGLAQAGRTIASPALPVPGTAGIDVSATCYVRNVGATPIQVVVQIFKGDGSAAAAAFQNCNDAPLDPGKNCDFGTAVNGDLLGCSATAVVGSAKNLRGTMELRVGGGTTVAEDLQ
jgi:hypothetical protein